MTRRRRPARFGRTGTGSSGRRGGEARGRRDRPDHYARKARNDGFVARSVYKLEEIDRRWGLLEAGQRVLDLGCAPGSWMQYAAQKVGAGGCVLGFDLKPVTATLPPQARPHVGDVFEIGHVLVGPFDVILSDMAPATTGNHGTDAARSLGLAENAVDLAAKHLRPGGHVVVKLLEGGDLPALIARLRDGYTQVQRVRPRATRKDSTELFVVAIGKKAPEEVG